jgi:hypothetical protein
MLRRNFIRYLILLLSIAALLIPVIRIEYDILTYTHGTLTFPLDDAFTELATAKTLAFQQVWGISEHSFNSVSSSPLYIIVLAVVFFIMGAHVVIPLVINVVAAIGFLVVLQKWLIRQKVRLVYQLAIMLVITYLIPIPLLIISGMAYPLELLFGFLFVITFISADRSSRRLFIYGSLMVMTSYETIILVIIAGVMLLQRRQWRLAFKMVGISFLPILLLGLLSVSKGGSFIPDSIWRQSPGQPRVSFGNVRQACMDMYDQEYQLARFVRRYYNKWPLAINQPGAISYYSEGKKLDFSGTADPEVMRSKRLHEWSATLADSLVRREDIILAILYDQWFSPGLLPRWTKIASWEIPNNLMAKEDSVSFYTIDQRDVDKLRRNLHEYQQHLPPKIIVRYY